MAQRPATIFALFAGLLGFAAAGFAPQLFHDGDSWWHLTAGAWMLDHHAVLRSDVFSFTVPGQPWDAQEWLSEIVMVLSFRAAGWNGLHLLFGAASGGAAAIVAYHVCARMAAIPALMVSVMGLACITGSLLARPHLLALPLLALWTLELLRAREQGRAPGWWLLGVMLLWANLHGSFAFGLTLAVAFALEAMLENRAALKGWGLFLLASLVAAAVTPQGLHGLLFPFQLLVMGSIRNIGEWAPTDLMALTPFPIALLGLVYLGATGRLKLPWLRLLILIGLVYLALAHVRHQMLFGIVAPMLITPGLGKIWPPEMRSLPRWLVPAGVAMIALLIAVRLVIPAARADDRVTPMRALASVPASLRAKPVLNAYDFGGYLIFSGTKVFVDGRTDMYGDDFLTRYDVVMKPDRKALSDALARWHIAWTILPPGSAAAMMDMLPGWHRNYSDAFAVIHIKD
jgi:hypothetical protein